MRCEDFELRLNQLLDLGDQIEDLSWDPDLHRHSTTCPSCRQLHRGYCAMQAGFAMLAAAQWAPTEPSRESEEPAPHPLAAGIPPAQVSGPGGAIWSARTLALLASLGTVLALAYLLFAHARLVPLPHGVGKLLDVATQRLETRQPVQPPRPLPEETVPGEAAIRSFVSRMPSIASDVIQRAVPVDETAGEPLRRMVSYLLDPQPLDDALPGAVLPSMLPGQDRTDAASQDQTRMATGPNGTSS